MKTFRIQIRAYGYYADFQLASEDSTEAFNNALVDKLGENAITWEKDGFIDHRKLWITYEEIIDADSSKRPLQSEERTRDRVGGATA
jgi:hypothetical protein|tara:strand:- start:367 stop:627 length:261 start_codon:yes stop_codon:yes gene_type:complete